MTQICGISGKILPAGHLPGKADLQRVRGGAGGGEGWGWSGNMRGKSFENLHDKPLALCPRLVNFHWCSGSVISWYEHIAIWASGLDVFSCKGLNRYIYVLIYFEIWWQRYICPLRHKPFYQDWFHWSMINYHSKVQQNETNSETKQQHSALDQTVDRLVNSDVTFINIDYL